jgi:hypothetical protein
MGGKVDVLEKVLVLNLGNQATYAQWRDEMFRVTLPKTNKKTGETRPGISEKTFDRRLKVIIERGHTVRPDDLRGGLYSIIAGPWAPPAVLGGGDLGDHPALPSPSVAVTSASAGDGLIAEALRHARLKRW